MCAERRELFAGKIVFFKERIHDHGPVAPPDGSANEDDVIILEVRSLADVFRARLFTLLLFGVISERVVRLGVNVFLWFDLEKVRSGLIGDFFRDQRRVPLCDIPDVILFARA